MKIRISKAFGKHPIIRWWANCCIFPAITIARRNDIYNNKPVYSIAFHWLFWGIEVSNNKSY